MSVKLNIKYNARGPDGNLYEIGLDEVESFLIEGGTIEDKKSIPSIGPDKETYSIPSSDIRDFLSGGGRVFNADIAEAMEKGDLEISPLDAFVINVGNTASLGYVGDKETMDLIREKSPIASTLGNITGAVGAGIVGGMAAAPAAAAAGLTGLGAAAATGTASSLVAGGASRAGMEETILDPEAIAFDAIAGGAFSSLGHGIKATLKGTGKAIAKKRLETEALKTVKDIDTKWPSHYGDITTSPVAHDMFIESMMKSSLTREPGLIRTMSKTTGPVRFEEVLQEVTDAYVKKAVDGGTEGFLSAATKATVNDLIGKGASTIDRVVGGLGGFAVGGLPGGVLGYAATSAVKNVARIFVNDPKYTYTMAKYLINAGEFMSKVAIPAASAFSAVGNNTLKSFQDAETTDISKLSEKQRDMLAAYTTAAYDPSAAIEDMKQGTFKKEYIEALETLYPQFWQEKKMDIATFIAGLPKPTIGQKMMIQQLLGIYYDQSMTPGYNMALNAPIENQQPQMMQPQVSKGRVATVAAGKSKLPNLAATTSDRVNGLKR